MRYFFYLTSGRNTLYGWFDRDKMAVMKMVTELGFMSLQMPGHRLGAKPNHQEQKKIDGNSLKFKIFSF